MGEGAKHAMLGVGSALVVGIVLKGCRTMMQHRAVARRRTEPALEDIAVGTQNPCKLAAVRALLEKYPHLADGAVGVSVPSGVNDQPMTMEETMRGAKTRAANALAAVPGAELALGIESGLFELGGELYDTCVCAVYDGKRYAIGTSCSFQLPANVQKHIRAGTDLSQACNLAGLTADPKLGDGIGCIGILSRLRLLRQGYTEQAVQTALVAMDPEWFPSSLPAGAFQP
eukprot:TRINITY_DN10384_c0_g1_i1.p1 TRINITY_DN10384_c0_g1~~TRINITY_DN10384_c0_g1_i1.p1  ORF type:complete len:229 (+),score=58.94 TRINITY_DN10384_c0_g1_i1:72-758(+)